MKVKLRNQFSELRGQMFTPKRTREYLQSRNNNASTLEVTVHNMNFYKIMNTDFLIHVYDVYEIIE